MLHRCLAGQDYALSGIGSPHFEAPNALSNPSKPSHFQLHIEPPGRGVAKRETHPDPPCLGREKSAGDLPNELATDKAIGLWKKAQEAGYVDENYQPLISRTQAALLADAMAERLGIKEKWKVFESFWHRKNMYKDYYDALNQKQSLVFQDSMKVVLS